MINLTSNLYNNDFTKCCVNNMITQVADDKHGFCKKDAIYFSCHKFIGGPQTPGILIAKKQLFDLEAAPVFPGGGTVLFVTETEQLYLKDIESKEEGGTPAIVESIRSGLVIQVNIF
jgi:selenocysteine lyase/cysteine desulfurase